MPRMKATTGPTISQEPYLPALVDNVSDWILKRAVELNGGGGIGAEESIGRILEREPERVFGVCTPDPWQQDMFRFVLKNDPTEAEASCRKALICCSRQSGKSQTAAGMALLDALCNPPATVLVVSKALRQSLELLRKVKDLYRGLRGEQTNSRKWRPRTLKEEVKLYGEGFDLPLPFGADGEYDVVKNNALSMEFNNGSRIISLPGSPDTIVGFSAITLLIIDEAARTTDALYSSLSPMRAVSQGKLACLSTPFGKRGWFFDQWSRCDVLSMNGVPADKLPWKRVQINAYECPRISNEFLEEEKEAIGTRWFNQEYCCSFEDVVGAVFMHSDIMAMMSGNIEELKFGPPELTNGRNGADMTYVEPLFKSTPNPVNGVHR